METEQRIRRTTHHSARTAGSKSSGGKPTRSGNKFINLICLQCALVLIVTFIFLSIKMLNQPNFQAMRITYDNILKDQMSYHAALELIKQNFPDVYEVFNPTEEAEEVSAPQSAPAAAGGLDIPVNCSAIPVCFTWKSTKPLSGTITSPFGFRIHPIDKTLGFHKGIDIAAAKDTEIGALYGGIVETAGTHVSYGNYIIIDHGSGVKSLYAHCSALLVEKGVRVRAGEKIALVGSTGVSTGYHLHLEITHNGCNINPYTVLFPTES